MANETQEQRKRALENALGWLDREGAPEFMKRRARLIHQLKFDPHLPEAVTNGLSYAGPGTHPCAEVFGYGLPDHEWPEQREARLAREAAKLASPQDDPPRNKGGRPRKVPAEQDAA